MPSGRSLPVSLSKTRCLALGLGLSVCAGTLALLGQPSLAVSEELPMLQLAPAETAPLRTAALPPFRAPSFDLPPIEKASKSAPAAEKKRSDAGKRPTESRGSDAGVAQQTRQNRTAQQTHAQAANTRPSAQSPAVLRGNTPINTTYSKVAVGVPLASVRSNGLVIPPKSARIPPPSKSAIGASTPAGKAASQSVIGGLVAPPASRAAAQRPSHAATTGHPGLYQVKATAPSRSLRPQSPKDDPPSVSVENQLSDPPRELPATEKAVPPKAVPDKKVQPAAEVPPPKAAPVAAPATLPQCTALSSDDRTLAVRELQSHLMVAGLSCGQSSQYNTFVRARSADLRKNGGELKRYFSKKHGGSATSSMNTYITRIANDASKTSMANRNAYCAESLRIFSELQGASKTSLADYVSSRPFAITPPSCRP